MGAMTTLFSILFLASGAYWAGVVFPLLRGDIAFGHPSYYSYRTESDLALLFVVASLVLYYGTGIYFRHRIRKGYVALGMTPEGTFSNVRQAEPAAAAEQ